MFRRWKLAADLYVRNFMTVLIVAAFTVGLEFFEAWRGKSFDVATLIPSLLLVGFVLFAFHVDELTGKKFKTSKLFGSNENLNKFVWRYIGMVLVLVPLAFFGAFLSGRIGLGRDVAEGLIPIVTVVLYGAVLAVFGTMFPAAAVGENAPLKAATRRGGQTFWMVVSGFLSGPLLSGLIVLATIYLASSAGVSADVMNEDGTYSIVGTVFSFFANVLFYYTSAIGVVVLCDAYRRAEGVEANPNEAQLDTFS